VTEGACVMGIDVGSQLHIRINKVLPDKKMQAVYIGTLQYSEATSDVKAIQELVKRYRVKIIVIDALPEQRLSRSVCSRIKGAVRWFHGEGKKDILNINARIVTTDRNLLLDDVKESILTNSLMLPKNARMLIPITNRGVSEYYDHLTSSTSFLVITLPQLFGI